MAENRHRHRRNPVRRCHRRLNDDGEDRLSSLPDAILAEILSRLLINSAASTFVLSHRWRHLWTGITRFELYLDESPKRRWHNLWTGVTPFEDYLDSDESPNLTDFLNNILMHLTSSKLDVFKIQANSFNSSLEPDEVESCFHEIWDRNVQQFIYNAKDEHDEFFPIPTCLLNCKSLVILELFGMLEFDYDWHKNRVVQLQLPNLKKLTLRYLLEVPAWLGSLSESSPLLEDLIRN